VAPALELASSFAKVPGLILRAARYIEDVLAYPRWASSEPPFRCGARAACPVPGFAIDKSLEQQPVSPRLPGTVQPGFDPDVREASDDAVASLGECVGADPEGLADDRRAV